MYVAFSNRGELIKVFKYRITTSDGAFKTSVVLNKF